MRSMSFRPFFAVAALLILALSACVPGPVKIAEPNFTPQDRIPLDARLAAAALLSALRGGGAGPGSGAVWPRRLAAGLSERDFDYFGFDLRGHRLDSHVQTGDRQSSKGALFLEGPFGRRADVGYEMSYSVKGGKLHVENAQVHTIHATWQETMAFLVPANRLPKDFGSLPASSWQNLFVLAKSASYQAWQKEPMTDELKPHVLFIFFRQRSAPGARVKVMAANRSDPDIGWGWCSSGVNYHSFNGWPVAMISGAFPSRPRGTFQIKAYFFPGKEAASQDVKLVLNAGLAELAGN